MLLNLKNKNGQLVYDSSSIDFDYKYARKVFNSKINFKESIINNLKEYSFNKK